MKKSDKKWIMLCSTAVAAVYAAGYFTTESHAVIGQQSAQNIIVKQVPFTNGSSANGWKLGGSQVASSGQSQSNAKSILMYKDGTFTGEGSNRRGFIDVQVTINNNQITDVQISNFGMSYPESDVTGLPSEVVQNQNAQVTNVSGATYSTQAFADAVQQALDQAKNA